jgi:transcriptional regulator with XRE-family HTH domain
MDEGRLLRHARLERGMNQAELARRAGTTQTYISRIERGVVSPSLKTLDRMLHAMGQRMSLSVEPLPHGNVSARELRADLHRLTPGERVEQAMELSMFLTDVATSAAEQERARRGTR